jgi:F0F1-type ATP synthase delta subunit
VPKGLLWTAFPLDGQTAAKISNAFSKILNETVELDQRVDPELLGGIRVEVGGRSYDGSIRGKLSEILRVLQNKGEESSVV